MTAISIDLGDKRCGIALEIEGIAIPKEIILRQDIIKVLENYFEKYAVIDTIVIGLPYDLYGIDNRQLDKTKKFIKQLENKYKNKKVIGVDERFSTFEAGNISQFIGGKNKNQKRDDISAALILESYLANSKN